MAEFSFWMSYCPPLDRYGSLMKWKGTKSQKLFRFQYLFKKNFRLSIFHNFAALADDGDPQSILSVCIQWWGLLVWYQKRNHPESSQNHRQTAPSPAQTSRTAVRFEGKYSWTLWSIKTNETLQTFVKNRLYLLASKHACVRCKSGNCCLCASAGHSCTFPSGRP